MYKYYLYFNHYPNSTNYNWSLWYLVSKLYKQNTFSIIKNNLNNYNLLKLSFFKFNYLFLVFYLNTFMLNDIFLNSKYRYLYVHHMFPKADLCYFFNISNIKITLLLHILLKFNINKFF